MHNKFVALLLLISVVGSSAKAQQCLTPGSLVTGKGIPMFMKSMSPNRIITGGVYYTSSQGSMTMAGDTLFPRTGDALSIFAAVLDSNLSLVRLFNVIGFETSGGSFNDTRVWDMHADALGNIYFSGSFTQDSLLSYYGDTVYSDGYQEAFIIRCDTMGITTMLKSCGTRSGSYKFEDRAHAITSDGQGNIIFTVGGKGSYFTINGDTANSTQNVGLNSYGDIFITSLYASGATRWIRNCGTPFKDDVAYDIAANATGEVSVCGGVNGSNTVFHFGQLSHTFRYSQYGLQGFVGKLDSSGVPIWLSPIEVYYPSGPDVGAYATVIDDSGFVYSSGYFDAWAIFNGDTIRTSNYCSNYFSKYNLAGQTQFVKLGNIDTFYPYPIYMDLNNNKVLITGQCYTNQLHFQQYGQCCQTEAYAAVYSAQGEVEWLRGAKAVNSSNPYFGMGCLNQNGTAYVCGTGSGGIVELAPLQIPISAANQYFIVKFAATPSNGLSLTITNSGNDSLTCGNTTQLIRTLVPSTGPTLTWWADNDTISLPNFVTNLNASPKMNTLYIATAFYNGCVVSDSIKLYVAALPSLAGNDTTICTGQFLSLVGNSLSGATYQWAPSNAVTSTNTAQTDFINTQSTQLLYTVSRAGCTSTDSLMVQVKQPAQSNFSYSNNQLDVSFTNTSSNYDSLYWDFGDSSGISNSINPQHTYSQNGFYTACLYTMDSCGNDSFCVTINLTTVGINEPKQISTIQLQNSGFLLQSKSAIGLFDLYDISGRCLQKGEEKSDKLFLNFSAFTSGCYFIRMQTEKGLSQVKLIWQKTP